MNDEEEYVKHKNRHKFLHSALDELVGDFISHTDELPSKATILALIQWSHRQTLNPTNIDRS